MQLSRVELTLIGKVAQPRRPSTRSWLSVRSDLGPLCTRSTASRSGRRRGGQVGTFAINFSRPAGQVISQYYEFLRLGREGYTKVQNAAYRVARYLAEEIAPLGPYEFIHDGSPENGLPAVCFRIKDGAKPGYTLYDLSDRLRRDDWQVPAFALSGKAADIDVMRIMCRRGFEMNMAALLIRDFKIALQFFKDHPPPDIKQSEGSGFHHT